ncbi:MAG: 30S ribosomal protein S5 [bacterium]
MAEKSKKGEFIEVEPKQEIVEKIVQINRYAKVHKGGKHFSFGVLVVVGNRNGKVGFAQGKAREVSIAASKGVLKAKKNMFTFPLYQTTIPHQVISTYSSTTVLLKPARPGTGVIAGGGVRALLEVGGVKDVYTKVIGSTNPHNVLKATAKALLLLMDPIDVMEKRGKVINRFKHLVEDGKIFRKKEEVSEPKIVIESEEISKVVDVEQEATTPISTEIEMIEEFVEGEDGVEEKKVMKKKVKKEISDE